MAGFSDLSGKVAVVTGGASGMGKGIAEQFKAAGAQVVIADIEQEALDRTANELGVVGIRTDVRSMASVESLAQLVLERFGKVHVVVNNAGVGPFGRISELSTRDWQWVLDVNLYGVIYGIQAFLPYIKNNPEGGHIINTSSVSGLMTAPMTGPYAVSKFGVVAVTEVLAQELQQENSLVGASVLVPGPTRTNIGRSSRNREDAASGGLADFTMEELGLFKIIPWKEPKDIGNIVIDGMTRGDLYIFTHAELLEFVRARNAAIDAAIDAAVARFNGAQRLGGMRSEI